MIHLSCKLKLVKHYYAFIDMFNYIECQTEPIYVHNYFTIFNVVFDLISLLCGVFRQKTLCGLSD